MNEPPRPSGAADGSWRLARPLAPARPAMPVSAIGPELSDGATHLGGPDPTHLLTAAVRASRRRRQRDLAAGEESQQQVVRLLRPLHLGNVPAGIDRDLLGAGEPLGDVTAECRRDQAVMGSP